MMRKNFVDVYLLDCNAIKLIAQTQSERRWSLTETLAETRNLHAIWPSDKIYSLLTLVPRHEADLVNVDYSLHPATVFRRYAESCLRGQWPLDILYQCVVSSTLAVLQLPSWTPDWTRPIPVESFSVRRIATYASQDKDASFELSPDKKILRVRGMLVDKISAIETSTETTIDAATYRAKNKRRREGLCDDETPESQARITSPWARQVLDMVFEGYTSSLEVAAKREEQLFRTYMCNRSRDNRVPTNVFMDGFAIAIRGQIEYHTPKNIIRTMEAMARAAARNPGAEEFDEDRFEWLRQAEKIVSGGRSKWASFRKFFMSESGSMGWSVETIEVGDEIAVVHGLAIPLVLRRNEDGNLTIVGDCWLDGVMDGEAIYNEKYTVEELELH